MDRPLSIDIEIGAEKYQIGRMKSRAGSWVLMQVLTNMMPASIEKMMPEGMAAMLGAETGSRSQMSESEFNSIQDKCLSVCRFYKNGLPVPVFVSPDTWMVPELEYDLTVVLTLTAQALIFNISDFFFGGGLKQLAGSLLVVLPKVPEPPVPTL